MLELVSAPLYVYAIGAELRLISPLGSRPILLLAKALGSLVCQSFHILITKHPKEEAQFHIGCS